VVYFFANLFERGKMFPGHFEVGLAASMRDEID
jgi:hypothetical protein